LSRVAATVVVALGSFGASVASRLGGRLRTSTGERPADVTVIELPLTDHGPKAPLGRVEDLEERISTAVESQLTLGALVERSAADASQPWLDVFVVGDIGDAAVRVALDPVLDAIGRAATTRFGHLLGRGARRVVAVPVLALGGARGGSDGPELSKLLEGLSRRQLPRVRSFLVEAQTSRYLLADGELVSSVVAMIELLVLAALRDHQSLAGFLRDESPRAAASVEPAPFGTFGVASVRVSGELLTAYCRNRAALAVVEAMRSGDEEGLAEREALARKLRVAWDEVREELGVAAQSDAAFEQVEAIVEEEAADLPCPPIELGDSPEQVRELKFGDDWHDTVCRSIDDLVERMERRRMPELVEQIDGNGLTLYRGRRDRLEEQVDEWVWSEPRGWGAALSALRILRDEAESAESEARARVARTSLPERPSVDRLRRAVSALRGEAARRPRPFRMWLGGLLLAIPATLFGYALFAFAAWLLAGLGASPTLVALAAPPWGLALSAALAVPFVVVALQQVIRDRHSELCEVRDELRRAMEGLIRGRQSSIVAAYVARLELARDLWVLRLARGERRRLESEIQRLEAVQRALDTLREQLRAAQRGLGVRYPGEGPEDDLRQVAPAGDLILREAVSGELLSAAYATAAPEEPALGPSFFEGLQGERPRWRGEVPMADLERIEGFLSGALHMPSAAELLGRGSEDDDPAGGTAREAVEGVLSDLAARLSPALEVHEAAVGSRTSWVVCAPDAAAGVIDAALESLRASEGSAFAADWLRLTSPRDDGQVYLATLVTHLPVAAIGTVLP